MLKALYHPENKRCQMSDAEVMTTAPVAALHFRGHLEAARQLLRTQGYIPHMLSKSRFNRRLHRLNELFLTFFHGLGEFWKTQCRVALPDRQLPEDALALAGLRLTPLRRRNARRAVPPWEAYLRQLYRRTIETTGSLLERLLPKSIHAVTARGFELKLVLFLVACSLNFLPW